MASNKRQAASLVNEEVTENAGPGIPKKPMTDREKAMNDLESMGYAVITDVLTLNECDEYQQQLKNWLIHFGGGFPGNRRSVIQNYSIGHLEPCWKARLKAKPAFADVWGTDKLLSSMDGIAFHKPPEEDDQIFAEPDQTWHHLDQGYLRTGLHNYQGAFYLEETSDNDWCFRIIQNSHMYHEDFFEKFPKAAEKTKKMEFYRLNKTELSWYKEKGCHEKKIPVPKGGLVLWDSRVVHDNCRPEKGRPHPERWRFVVFVCMTPAIWASEADLRQKEDAYTKKRLTSHQASQVFRTFPRSAAGPRFHKTVARLDRLPDVALTTEAKLLAGVERYDFNDGNTNGPIWTPVWKTTSN